MFWKKYKLKIQEHESTIERLNKKHSYFGKIENYERRLTFGEIDEVAEWIGVNSGDIITRAKEIIQQENHGKNNLFNSSSIH